jgi:hypothetical protein
MSSEITPSGANQSKMNQCDKQVTIIVTYYVFLLAFFLAFLLDFWTDTFMVLKFLGFKHEVLSDLIIKAIGFTIMGGIIGSVLYHVKMLFYYYTYIGTNPKRQYNPRWFGKYISAPFEGAALSLVVLSLIRGGIAAFGATMSSNSTTGDIAASLNAFTAFGLGGLVGFGARDVIAWIQNLAKNMFVNPEENKEKQKQDIS